MADRVITPEWKASNQNTRFPFSSAATLTNAEGRVLLEGVMLDAALYVIGATAGLFLAAAEVTFQTVTLTLATPTQPDLATGVFDLIRPPDQVVFYDAYGRPAGTLVSESRRLGLFQSWGVGRHEFLAAQTEFAASCVFPTPEVGVRGIRLETGQLFVGDVWLVGDAGVVLRVAAAVVPVPGTARQRTIQTIRVDVVGDPLFRRRLCQPENLFATPRFLRAIRVVGQNMTFDVAADAGGNVRLSTMDAPGGDTVLRVKTTDAGIEISAVGSVANF